jgi:hypothetical protein
MESEGRGSLFWFTINVKIREIKTTKPPFVVKPRVLVVYPNSQVRKIMGEYLLMWDIEHELHERPPSCKAAGIVFTSAFFLNEIVNSVAREKTKIIVIGHPTELKEIEVGIAGLMRCNSARHRLMGFWESQ